MKKHTRIGLMVLVTVALLLALAVPVLAGERGGSLYQTCSITPPHWDKNGEIERDFKIWGVLDWYTIDGGIVNECEGDIPLGEVIHNSKFTFLSFEELCNETPGKCDGGTYYLDDSILPATNLVVDPMNKLVYWSPNYVFTVDPDGHFLFVKTYDYPVE